MRIYSVHEGPGSREAEGTVLVPESFAFWAFIFPLAWLLVKKLWLAFVLVLSAQLLLAAAEADGWIPGAAAAALQFCVSLFVGLEGRNWLRAKLARKGFAEKGIVAGTDLPDAEARWFAAVRP